MAVLGTVSTKVEARLESGNYSGRIRKVETGIQSQYGEAAKFFFDVDKQLGGDGWEDLDDTVELTSTVTMGRITPGTKLYKVASAAFGRELQEAERLDTDDLEGKRLVLTVEKVNKEGKTYSNITGYGPWKKKAAASASASASASAASAPTATTKAPTPIRKAPVLDDDDDGETLVNDNGTPF